MTTVSKLVCTALLLVTLAFAGLATGQEFSPAVVFDMGGKFDKSFNEAAYRGIERWKKETGKPYLEFEVANETQRVRMAATGQSNQRLAANFIVILRHPSQERVLKLGSVHIG